jgi:hypothetical protein
MKQRIIRNFINSLGYKTNKKIVVIESDDWGAIRMPSKKAYHDLVKKGVINDDNPFTKYDSLASGEDLNLLFEVLSSVKGADGKPAILTADCIMANPDFERIIKSGYKEYYYETFAETLKKYPNHSKCFDIWKQGINQKIFKPQLHGREHLNVLPWLKHLRQNEKAYSYAFERGTYAINANIVAALNYRNIAEREYLDEVINDACVLFEKAFGFKSDTFIAPNYTWDSEVEQSLKNNSIDYLQGSKTQNVPTLAGKNQIKYHYTGQKNKLKQTYLVRNCLFEPSISPHLDYVSVCMKHISSSFYWKKPAIISSHRLNYVGYLDEGNRDKNLRSLKDLLNRIIKTWPDVIFTSTDELAKHMSQ